MVGLWPSSTAGKGTNKKVGPYSCVDNTVYSVYIYIYAYMYSNIHMFVNLAFVFLDVLETFIETYL